MTEKFSTADVKKILQIPHATLFKYIQTCKLNVRKNDKGNLEFSPEDIENIKLIMSLRDEDNGFNTINRKIHGHEIMTSSYINHDDNHDFVIEDAEYIEEENNNVSTALVERIDSLEDNIHNVMTMLKDNFQVQTNMAHKIGTLEAELKAAGNEKQIIMTNHDERLKIMTESHNKDLANILKEIERKEMEALQKEKELEELKLKLKEKDQLLEAEKNKSLFKKFMGK